ncbi:MAG: hypothetical protein LC101_11035 [Flavobacteriales bacterium]|nr:hypothetical protein [Flavobacteriales bacterium]
MATSYFSNIDINKTYQFNYSKETLENRLSNIDSLHITFTDNNPDSTYFFFPFHKWGLCNTVDIDIVITEIDTNVTLLKLVKSSHRCQADKNDKALIIEAFEKEIIEKLKTNISINDSSRQ